MIGRARLEGFFATETGTEAPAGSRVVLEGFMSQGGAENLIGEPLTHEVDGSADLEGALFDLQAEQRYLVAGTRGLSGSLTISFARAGQKMAVPGDVRVSLNPPYRDQAESP